MVIGLVLALSAGTLLGLVLVALELRRLSSDVQHLLDALPEDLRPSR